MGTFLRGGAVILSLLAIVLVVSTLSTAGQADHFSEYGTEKAEVLIFSDGFESGDTSRWGNGTSAEKCSATLIMPVDLAD